MSIHSTATHDPDDLSSVLLIARQIDAEGLSASERANVAVSYVVENAQTAWSLARQRKALADATRALQAELGQDAPA
ncbi:hypothetical protein, partial [Sulfitobacter sp.]|uniref:hypothetical protein n=1 Tax=Sulfitobacter sp. TaxID=1903071 RepID=UPI003563A80D